MTVGIAGRRQGYIMEQNDRDVSMARLEWVVDRARVCN
jgi:hypothetical protein